MPAGAAPKEQLTIKGRTEGQFARVFFYCRQPVNFNVSLKGNRLSVHFDRSFTVNFGDLQKSMKEYLSGAAESGDGKTVILFLNAPDYRFRQFVSESFVGVDLLPSAKTLAKASPPPAEKKAETPPPAPPEKKEEKKPAQDTVTLVNNNTELANPEGDSDDNAGAPTPTIPEAPGPIYKDTIANPKTGEITLSSRLLFPWEERVNAAVFTRGTTLWIIFDKFRRVDLSRFMKQHADIVFYGEQLKNRQYTIVRFDLTRQLFPKMRRRDFTWEVELYDKPVTPTLPIDITSEFRSPPGPYVLLQAFPGTDPLRMVDPEIGDTLLIVPLFAESNAVSVEKSFVDFSLLPTAEGIVVPLQSDDVKMRYVSNGVEITSPSLELFRDSQLTAPLPASVQDPAGYAEKLRKQEEAAKAKAETPKAYTIYPLDLWKRGGNATFVSDRKTLEQSIIAASPSVRAAERLKLAQFFLAHRLLQETLSVLSYLQYRDPVANQGEDVRRTRALTLYLLGHYREARDLFAQLKPDNPVEASEIIFWKEATAFAVDESEEPLQASYNRYTGTFLDRYPLWLKQKLLLAELGYHIRHKDFAAAKVLLPLAKNLDSPRHPIKNDIAYFNGVILAQEGDTKQALKLWKPLTVDVLDRRNRARASFATLEVLLREGKLTQKQAINRLEHLRLMWRGDDLELNVLKILGQLYIDNKQYRAGMAVWRDIVTYFPQTADALFVAKKMIQTFVYLFNQGGADNLSPMKALALYNEFKEWTPIGKPGEIMVQNLVERLFQADLLDQAASLLSNQVKYRLEGEEKVVMGTRLALIYLLDKKPSIALAVLDALDEKGLPAVMVEKRRLFRAQALMDMEKYQRALTVLNGDNGVDANLIRQEIYWRTKQWIPLIALLSPYVTLMADTAGVLEPEQSDAVLKLTVVFSLQNNTPALNKLYKNFHGRIPPEHKQAMVFEFLAGNRAPVNYKDFNASVQLEDFQTFLSKYGKKAKEEGLKAANGAT